MAHMHLHMESTRKSMLRELGCVMWREKVRPFEPPPPSERDLLGGQPPPLPPAPEAYAPLTGAGCGAPLELIVEVVVVEAVAELSAEMAVDVVLPALRVA